MLRITSYNSGNQRGFRWWRYLKLFWTLLDFVYFENSEFSCHLRTVQLCYYVITDKTISVNSPSIFIRANSRLYQEILFSTADNKIFMKGNLRLKKLPCSSHHKKYLIGQHKSVSISGASWRARMTDIWQDLQSWSCLAPQPDGRHLIIHPRRCIILVLRENFPPYTAALSY